MTDEELLVQAEINILLASRLDTGYLGAMALTLASKTGPGMVRHRISDTAGNAVYYMDSLDEPERRMVAVEALVRGGWTLGVFNAVLLPIEGKS